MGRRDVNPKLMRLPTTQDGYRQTADKTLIHTSLERGVWTRTNEENRFNGFRKPLKRLLLNERVLVTSLKRGVNESPDI